MQNPERSWILLHGQYILKHFVLGLIDAKNYLNVTTREQSQIVLSANQRRVDYFTLRKNQNRPHTREFKTVLDAGLHTMDSGFSVQILDSRSLSVELGFRIPLISGISGSQSCIPESKAQDFVFQEKKFPGLRISQTNIFRIPSHRGDKNEQPYCFRRT